MQPRHHVVVVAEHLDPVPTDTPVHVAATTTLDEVPEPDIVMVPGGGAPTLRQLANPSCSTTFATPTALPRWSPPCAPARSFSPAPACCKAVPPPPTGPTTASWSAWGHLRAAARVEDGRY